MGSFVINGFIMNLYVSVIIPNYCHSKYLEQRIQSVLNQTYQNFEVIILDDCSPDDGASKGVIERYRDNSHVSNIVYNERNSGSTFKQWQKGFELAKGDYIWIAESDDYCKNDHLEALVCQANKDTKVAIAFCQSQYVDSMGDLMDPIFVNDDMIEYFSGIEFIKKHMLYGNAIWNASSAIFRRDYALSINKQYMNFVSAGDRLFWIELAEKGNVVFLHNPRNYFRQHDNKVTPQKQLNGITSLEDLKIVKYLESRTFISFLERLYMYENYLTLIENSVFYSDEIRLYLLKKWRLFGCLKKNQIQMLAKIVLKISNLHIPV